MRWPEFVYVGALIGIVSLMGFVLYRAGDHSAQERYDISSCTILGGIAEKRRFDPVICWHPDGRRIFLGGK